jgi:tetratricopeptide (TPR) repeat protein
MLNWLPSSTALHNRGLRVRKEVWGPEHPRVVLSLESLGYFYSFNERYNEAEAAYAQSLSILENSFLLYSLGCLYHLHFKRYQEAEKYYRHALEAGEEAYGGTSDEVEGTIKQYCDLLRTLGREEEARKLEARLKTRIGRRASHS